MDDLSLSLGNRALGNPEGAPGLERTLQGPSLRFTHATTSPPTAPGHPTLAEVATAPLGTNARLGRFTNSTNLLGLAAVAVPAGEVNGLPFGAMLIGPAFTDDRLARIAALLQPETRLAVVGARLSGQPLNPQLLALAPRRRRGQAVVFQGRGELREKPHAPAPDSHPHPHPHPHPPNNPPRPCGRRTHPTEE